MDSEAQKPSDLPPEMGQWIPSLEFWGSVLEVLAFIVIFIVLPILIFSGKKYVHGCFKELRRQNHLLEEQNQAIGEMNQWMKYFNDKLIEKENPQPPDKKEEEKTQPTPISLYKKTI